MSSSDRTEREGVFAVGLFAEQAGWAFRELPRPDHGVDAQIEGRTDARPDGRLIALQIKAGPSQFKNRIRGGWRFYLDSNHVAYWLNYRMPVLLVLYDPRIETAYWQMINADTTVEAGSGLAIDVPESQVFDSRCSRQLDRVAKLPMAAGDIPADSLPDRQDVLDLQWMWMLHDGERLYLEVDERLDPRDGRCVLRLIAENQAGEITTQRMWPWMFLPRPPLAEELSDRFPWADLAVDWPFYRQRVIADFLAEHGRWVPEEADYELDADFNGWLRERFGPAAAPYATSRDGSAALWRLELRLNTTGEQAIKQDEKEMFEIAHADMDAEDVRTSRRPWDYYELRSIEHTYSKLGYLDQLVFVYGDDDEGYEDFESLLVEPRLTDANGDPEPMLVDAILRHAAGVPATTGLAKAFGQRFAEQLDGDDGIPSIPLADVASWLNQLESIAGDAAKTDE